MRRILITILVLGFCGCVKVDDKLSNNQLLTNRSSKQWTNYSYTINGVEDFDRVCKRNNIWTFNDKGEITISPGLVRCQVLQSIVNFDYFFGSTDNNSIFINITYDLSGIGPSQLTKFVISKLTSDEMVLTASYVSPDGTTPYELKLYFTAID